MGHGQKGGNARTHGISHHMGFRDAEMIEQRHGVFRHDRRIIGVWIMRLVACAMAAIVDGNHPVARIPECFQPAGMYPVDVRAGGKAMNQQNRLARRITLVEIGKAKAVMGKIGKLRRVEIHHDILLPDHMAGNRNGEHIFLTILWRCNAFEATYPQQ